MYYVTERSGMIYDICALCVRAFVLCAMYVYGPEGIYLMGRKAIYIVDRKVRAGRQCYVDREVRAGRRMWVSRILGNSLSIYAY